MADVNANIGVNIDTSAALAQLKALQRQISQFHTSIAKSSETAALAQRDLQKNFLNSVNAIGAFSAELRTVKTTAESFTDSLQKNKFSMREYFRYAGASTKTFGKLFKSEFDTIGKVADDRVKRLQTQYIKLGRDTSGAMKAIAIMPNQLDMGNFSTQSQIAAQKQAIFNQLVKQGSTNLLNFGKNTQWAGRQLMVGFTLPLATLGTVATRTFMEMEAQTIKFRKVYGDLFTPTEETNQALDNITALGQMFTKYGVAVSQTVGLAAEAAAAGFSGVDLQRQTTEATRLSVLGQIDANKALETTISLQNAFKMSSENLASSIDFLNAVENQTVVSLDDITTAIPKVAPVIQQLGGDVKDLAFFMAAMKEGGINASEGANALKSGLAALINPTTKASAMLEGYGINIKKIVEGNQGDLKATVIDFATALDTLDPLTRARAIEQLFGKFQFARLSTLFDNVTNQSGQAARVLELAGTSIEDLSALSEKELGMTADSAMNKFRKSVEDLKLALVPVGQTFLQAVTPIVEFIGGILDRFNNLSDGVKKAIVVLTVAIGAIGPIALMTFGLLANGLANIVKGALVLRNGYLRLTGQTQILGEQTEYLTMEQIDAAAASHSLDQSHARLTQTFTAESSAVTQLIAAYQQATAAGAKFAAINPGMMRAPGAPTKRAKGKPVVVGGTGSQDTELALLMPGETVIPADMSKQYGALINGMIAGNIPGYQVGRGLPGATDFAHITNKAEVQIGSLLKMLETAPKTLSQSMMMTLKELATVFGEQLKVFIYSGLGFTQSKQLNIGMAGGKAVPAQDFLSDFEQQGLAKWNKSLSIAGVKTDAVAEELATYDSKLQNAVRSMIDIDQNATITSDQFAAIEKEIRSTLPEFSQLRQALDTAQQALTEVRYNINEQTAVGAGLTPIQVASKKDPTQMSKKKSVQLPSGRRIRLGGDHLVGRGAGGLGTINTSMLTQTATQVTDQAVLATAQAAGTNSPSRKTIPIGEDIARGLQVGMANQQDEVAASGQALGSAAVGGTQSGGGRRRRGASRPQGAPGVMGLSGAANSAVSPAIKDAIDTEVKARKTSAARIDSMNKGLMAGTFALTSLAGAGSMANGPLGDLSQHVMKFSGLLFALMSVTQLLTQAKFAELVATRAKTVADLMGSKTVGGLFSRGGGLAGFGKNILTASKFVLRFAGPIGLLTTAIIGTISVIKMVNAARERERLAIEGLADAMTTTTTQVKTLGDFFNVLPTKLPFELGQREFVAKETRTQRESLKADPGFQKEFKSTIESLRKATNDEAKIVFSSLALNLKAQGFASDQVQVIIDALREESSQTDVALDVKSLTLSKESLDQLKKDIAPILVNLDKALDTGITKKFVGGGGGKGFSAPLQEIVIFSKEAQKQLETTSEFISETAKSASGMFELGLIDGATYEATLNTILETTRGLDEAQRKLLLQKVFQKLGADASALNGILGRTVTEMRLLALMSSGIFQKGSPVLEGLKAPKNSKEYRNALIQINRQYDKMFGSLEKIAEEEKKRGTVGGDSSGTEKSPFQLAIEQLQNQRKELENTKNAYNVLTKAGFDSATATKYASDSVIALGLATGNIDLTRLDEFEKKMKALEKLSNSESIRTFLDNIKEENTLKKSFAAILPTFQKLGATTKDIENVLNNPTLMKSFVEGFDSAGQQAERIKKYLDAVRTGEAIDITFDLIINPDKAKEELKRKADELFGFLERAAQREYKPKIIDAEKEVANAQGAVDKIQVRIDAIQDKIDLEQRNLETGINRKIEQYQEQVADLQRTIEIQFDRPIEAIQDQIGTLERGIELTFDRPIAALQKSIAEIEREIDLNFDRPIEALQNSINEIERGIELTLNRPLEDLQKTSSDLSNDLTLIDKASESINEKYDAQAEALQKVSTINQQILNQQKQQLSIADALTQGDISAAAQAIQESRGTSADIASANAENTLQIARQLELDELRNSAGLTRKQIEEAQFVISQKIFNIEKEREKLQSIVQAKQDQIFAIEKEREQLQSRIKIKQDEIFAIEKEREIVQARISILQDKIFAIEQARQVKLTEIKTIEDSIYLLEEQREAVMLTILGYEDDIYNIKVDELEPAVEALKIAQDSLQALRDELQARLDNINLQRDAWQAAEDAEIAAAIAAGEYNDVLTATVGLLNDMLSLWQQIAAAAQAAANATLKPPVNNGGNNSDSYIPPEDTPESEAALKEFLRIVAELDAAMAAVEAGANNDAEYDRLQQRLAAAQKAYDDYVNAGLPTQTDTVSADAAAKAADAAAKAADAAAKAADEAAATADATSQAADAAAAEYDAAIAAGLSSGVIDNLAKMAAAAAKAAQDAADAVIAAADAAAKAAADAEAATDAAAKAAADGEITGSGSSGGGRSYLAASSGGMVPRYLSSGGMAKPKYFSVGGSARGTDIIPAMLTPGEFVMSKYAVNSYGVDKMKAMNSGSYEGEKVYNYNLSVNVKSDANPDDIARVVMTQIRQIDSQRIRTQRV